MELFNCISVSESVKTDLPINFNIIFCWVPSHIGLTGNERVDTAARDALDLEISDYQIPPLDFRPLINLYITNKWQKKCDENKNNKLYEKKLRIKRSCMSYIT